MEYLVIQNSGEMDINALFLMGASSKEGDNSKIGFFGSGNKYALTTLLRKCVNVHIFSGITEYKLSLCDTTFRGETFQQVYINDQPTSFTTRMGPQWEEWMALREFICNAKDEGGYNIEVIDSPSISTENNILGKAGETRIYVSMTASVQMFYDSITEYIIDDSIDILDSTKECKIMESDTFAIYRKGIRCSIKSDKKALFSYDIDNISINESRVFDREWEMKSSITKVLQLSNNKEVISKIIENCKDVSFFESDLYWASNDFSNYSDTWFNVLNTGQIIFNQSCLQFLPMEDSIGQIVLPDDMFKGIKKSFPKLKWYNNLNDNFLIVTGTQEQIDIVEMADTEVRSYGYKESNIFLVKFFEKEHVARVFNKNIYLSVDYLEDYDELCSTLLEEHEHLDNGFMDGTRKFEQYLCKQLILAKRSSNRYKELSERVVVDEEKSRLLNVINSIKNTLELL